MAGHYTLTGEFQLLSEEQGTLYNVGISDIELSSDATKGQGILLRSGETQAFKGTIYARSYDESGSLNVQNFIELPGGGESGGGGGGTPYTLPTMAQNVKGGAKVGAGLTMTGEVLSLSPIYVPSAAVETVEGGMKLTVTDHNGTTSASIMSGADGADGETPTISTASIEGGNAVTFGTSAGFWTINIMDGKDGANGVSPTVAAETITGGNAVTFTSAAGMATINIMDGTPGANGIGVTMTADSIEGGTALKMRSASGWTTVNVMNGKDGAPGADGKSFEIKAQYATEAALIAAHPTGQAGDAYLVGDDTNPDLYVWLSDAAEWQNSGPIAGIVGPQGPKGDDGVSARVTISSIVGGNRVTFTDGYGTQSCAILNGTNGSNGVSPVVSVSTKTGGHVLKITDALGETSFDVMDGENGLPGADGKSISFYVSSVVGGNRVTLTDGTESNSFDVLNGADGQSVTVETSTINGGNAVTFTDKTGGHTVIIYNGQNGVNGVSPIITTESISGGTELQIRDAVGLKTVAIYNGTNGTNGVPFVRKESTTYAVGDIAYSPLLPSWAYLECVTAGTTAAADLVISGTPGVGDSITDGTVVWTVKKVGSGIQPHITVTAPTGCTITCANGGTTLTAAEQSGVWEFDVPRLGNWTLTCSKTIDGESRSASKVVNVQTVKNYEVQMSYGLRYGFRIKKSEGQPTNRVEYLFDAVGMEPAYMDFANGVFEYGDWGDKWFVTGNKPCMLKSDGTVDYYLDPTNYAYKEDGTASDISNANYDGNGMAQFPLVWVKRYEDETYEYEIVSDVQYDSDYKAYAHTKADGTIADFFYWSLFGGSGNASKIRSLKGQTLANSLTAQQEITGCQANGSGWYTHTWSQRELIQTLLILMGKSTNVQTVFGHGNNTGSGSSISACKATGTLSDKGQFFGYSASQSTVNQVKVFHIEKFWGDQWDRTAGIINNGQIYVKMTPEGNGYRITDTVGYTPTGISLGGTNGGYISAGAMTEYGFIPRTISGSASTYYCDGAWFNNSQLDYLLSGTCAGDASGVSGAFTFHVAYAPGYAGWAIGCGLSFV